MAAHYARRQGLELDWAGEVTITSGATEAIAASLLALCEPGDEVIAFDPTYDSYRAAAAMAGWHLSVAMDGDPRRSLETADDAELSRDWAGFKPMHKLIVGFRSHKY